MEHKRSLFWPLLLIAAGVVWLLVKSGTVPSANLWALTHIWPFLLIAAGLGIILRSYWSYASILLDVVIIGGALLAILYAPQLGWASPSMLSMFSFGESFIGPGERGSGNVVSSTCEVSGFDAVSVEYPAQVLIKQGNTESLKIEAEDNLLPNLKTQVQNGTLEIFYRREGNKHVNPTKPVKITIVVKDVDEVDFSSAGELIIENLETDRLDVSLSGAGNVDLDQISVKELTLSLSGAGSANASGTADSLDLSISGFGDFKGEDLHDKTAQVSISGAGSATVWVDEDLTAQVSGAGSVSYYGSPSVSRQISGVGGVNHIGNK
ncbi:MAG: GIN domain-containing protein [Anaerolineales bacterium]